MLLQSKDIKARYDEVERSTRNARLNVKEKKQKGYYCYLLFLLRRYTCDSFVRKADFILRDAYDVAL